MWIKRADLKLLTERTEVLLSELGKLQDRSYLISIERSRDKNVFIFSRNGKPVQIETYGTIADNLPEWKESLLR